MQLKTPIPLGLDYHYESRKAKLSPLRFQDLEWKTKTIHEVYQGPCSPRAYQLERGWEITATLRGVLVGRYASFRNIFFFFFFGQHKKLGKSLNFHSLVRSNWTMRYAGPALLVASTERAELPSACSALPRHEPLCLHFQLFETTTECSS